MKCKGIKMDIKEIKEIIKEDKRLYFEENVQKRLFHKIVKNFSYYIGKYIIYARLSGYYKENRKSFKNKILCIYYMRKKNKLGLKLNVDIAPSYFGRNLRIWHGNIVINYDAKIGDNCQLHGNNCIGVDKNQCPLIGNNVDIGVGANIIGGAVIANNVIIGANSLVNKSFIEENIVIAGVPAKRIK